MSINTATPPPSPVHPNAPGFPDKLTNPLISCWNTGATKHVIYVSVRLVGFLSCLGLCAFVTLLKITTCISPTSSDSRHTVPAGAVHSGLRGGCWTCGPRAVHWAGWDLCEGWQRCWVEGNSQVRISYGSRWQQLLTAWQLHSLQSTSRYV